MRCEARSVGHRKWPPAPTGDRASGYRSMTESNPEPQEVTDAQVQRAGVFGYDAKGRAHRYDTVRARIIVTADGDVEHVEDLARNRVVQWIDYVQQRVGWIDQWWSTTNGPDVARRRRVAAQQAQDVRYERARADEADTDADTDTTAEVA